MIFSKKSEFIMRRKNKIKIKSTKVLIVKLFQSFRWSKRKTKKAIIIRSFSTKNKSKSSFTEICCMPCRLKLIKLGITFEFEPMGNHVSFVIHLIRQKISVSMYFRVLRLIIASSSLTLKFQHRNNDISCWLR